MERQRLVRHACSSLIKQGHSATLRAIGYKAPRVKVEGLTIKTPVVKFGENLEFELSLVSLARKSQPLIIDYAVHHQKANGQLTPKVFKWKAVNLSGDGSLVASRRHPMREITTRKYYPGLHRLEILINGKSIMTTDFRLKKP